MATGVLHALGHIQTDVCGKFFPQICSHVCDDVMKSRTKAHICKQHQGMKQEEGILSEQADQLQMLLSASPLRVVTFLGRCLSGYTNKKYKFRLLSSEFQPRNQAFKFKSAVYKKIKD